MVAVIKVVERSWIKETAMTNDLTWGTKSGLLHENLLFCQPKHPPKDPPHSDFAALHTMSPNLLQSCSMAAGDCLMKFNHRLKEIAGTDIFYRKTV